MTHPIPPVEPPPDVFAARRAKVFEALAGGVMVLPSAPVLHRSRDTEVRYRPDSELYYLTGAWEPDCVAVLVSGDAPRCELFVRPRDEVAELWAGPRLGPEGTAERLGISVCHSIEELDARLPALLDEGTAIHYRQGKSEGLDRAVAAALVRARARGQRRGTGPRSVVDPGEILDEMRLVKDALEIERLRTACGITVVGHRAGAGAVAPGRGEWEVEAAIEAAFRSAGGFGPGFPSIVGAGANACVLHYVENHARIGPDDLVLIDAGAEYGLYHGDITRTYPAGGSFSAEQRAVYDVVEAARAEALRTVAPGVAIAAVHQAAVAVIVEGLVELGVLSGDSVDLTRADAHRDFFPHNTSHWLGLDVHDPGDYEKGGVVRTLEPGMVFTIEPGLYFRPGVGGEAAARLAGIGVRIEDDILVTADGHENLTAALPTAADEVESMVREGL